MENILVAQPRDAKAKGKQLRRNGLIPAVLFGKHMEESLLVQIEKPRLDQFLVDNKVGATLTLKVGKKEYPALVKDITYTPLLRDVEHLSLQALTAGEKVTSEFHIHLHNRAKVDGIVQQQLSMVAYRALPRHLFDTVDVELEGKVPGDSAVLGDLDFVNNPDIEILTPLDTPVYSIAHRKLAVEEEEETTEEGAALDSDTASEAEEE